MRNQRGEKAVAPMQLLPSGFEGEAEMVEALNAQRSKKASEWRSTQPLISSSPEGEESEEESCDDEYEDWPSPDGSYVRELQDAVAHFKAEADSLQEPSVEPSIRNMEYFVEWLSWQSWDPCHAWKGLSGGTWPEKIKEHFGKSIPGKAKTFTQGIAGIVAWNNNGTTYTYPKAIWTFLQKHSSYDIERVAQDVVKGIETTDAICHWCVQPRIVGKDYYEDGSRYCKSCFLSWQGIGPRGMSDKGRLNKSKKGKFKGSKAAKGKKAKGRKP